MAQVASGLTMTHYADERLLLPDALQQLREALAAAPPPPLATPPPTTSSPVAPPDERTCVVCWDAPREVSYPFTPSPPPLYARTTFPAALGISWRVFAATSLLYPLYDSPHCPRRCASPRAVTRSAAAAVPRLRAAARVVAPSARVASPAGSRRMCSYCSNSRRGCSSGAPHTRVAPNRSLSTRHRRRTRPTCLARRLRTRRRRRRSIRVGLRRLAAAVGAAAGAVDGACNASPRSSLRSRVAGRGAGSRRMGCWPSFLGKLVSA